MVFTVLSAGIDLARKLLQEPAVDFPPDGRIIQLAGVDAAGDRAEAERQERLHQLACLTLPDRKESVDPQRRQGFFAVGPEVFQKDVAEGDVVDVALAV